MLVKDRTIYSKLQVKPLMVFALLTLTACTSKDEVLTAYDDGKQAKSSIELSVSIAGSGLDAATRGTTRTVTTDNPYGQQAKAFEQATTLYMVMKNEKEEGEPLAVTGKEYTYTSGEVPATANPAAGSADNVTFGSGFVRYWDDTFARDSKLSIYAACVPGKDVALTIGGASTYNSNTWTPVTPPATDAPSTTIVWPLGRTEAKEETDQTTGGFIASQDLCFSNNISSASRLCYNNTQTNKFDHGKLIFYHALTKITFRLKKGSTFGSKDAFEFTNEDGDENIELVGFNTSGTLDIATGEWGTIGTETINKMAVTEDNRTGTADSYGIADGKTYAYVLDALLLPGSDLNSSATDEINFHIDHNTYHITKAQLVEALKVNGVMKTLTDGTTDVLDGTRMLRGVHYIFTLEVNKKDIGGISAAVASWEEVTAAEKIPTNVKVAVDLLDEGSAVVLPFNLYRLVHVHNEIAHEHADYEWMNAVGNPGESDYTESGNKVTISSGSSPYDTGWYWPNNKTFYHFRAVRPTSKEVKKDTNNGDYIPLTRGTAPGTYTDVLWGAPFTDIDVDGGTRLEYTSANGFDKKTYAGGDEPTYSQIWKAIGPTEGTINLEMFHMMSDVSIVLKTTGTSDPDHVNLSGAVISLSNIYPHGVVRMGNGRVQAGQIAGSPATFTPATGEGTVTTSELTLTYNSSTDQSAMEHFGFVPQDLTGVVLTITTADNNQYEVALKDVAFGSYVTNYLIKNPYTDKITEWYPNMKYTYTFKLKKKGVEAISATIAEWESVEAGEKTVEIE